MGGLRGKGALPLGGNALRAGKEVVSVCRERRCGARTARVGRYVTGVMKGRMPLPPVGNGIRDGKPATCSRSNAMVYSARSSFRRAGCTQLRHEADCGPHSLTDRMEGRDKERRFARRSSPTPPDMRVRFRRFEKLRLRSCMF